MDANLRGLAVEENYRRMKNNRYPFLKRHYGMNMISGYAVKRRRRVDATDLKSIDGTIHVDGNVMVL